MPKKETPDVDFLLTQHTGPLPRGPQVPAVWPERPKADEDNVVRGISSPFLEVDVARNAPAEAPAKPAQLAANEDPDRLHTWARRERKLKPTSADDEFRNVFERNKR